MTTTRIYRVRNRDTGAIRLVECGHRNTALRHVALSAFDVSTITAAELRRLQADGVRVEDVSRGEQMEVEQDDGTAAAAVPPMPPASLLDISGEQPADQPQA